MPKEEGVEGTRARGVGSERAVLEPRPIGPGRIERGYQRRIAELEGAVGASGERCGAAERELMAARVELAGAQGDVRGLRGELDAAARLERGLQRHADKLEQRLDTASQREKRLILALGSLQKENELLRERLVLASAERAALPAAAAAGAAASAATAAPSVRPARRSAVRARPKPERAGLFARLFGRGDPA